MFAYNICYEFTKQFQDHCCLRCAERVHTSQVALTTGAVHDGMHAATGARSLISMLTDIGITLDTRNILKLQVQSRCARRSSLRPLLTSRSPRRSLGMYPLVQRQPQTCALKDLACSSHHRSGYNIMVHPPPLLKILLMQPQRLAGPGRCTGQHGKPLSLHHCHSPQLTQTYLDRRICAHIQQPVNASFKAKTPALCSTSTKPARAQLMTVANGLRPSRAHASGEVIEHQQAHNSHHRYYLVLLLARLRLRASGV